MYPGPLHVRALQIVPLSSHPQKGGHRRPRRLRSALRGHNDDAVISERYVLKIQGNVKRGQQVVHEGDVIVYGNVEPGAEVQAGGDITILGGLEGRAQAGYPEDIGAVIQALSMSAESGQIAGYSGPVENKDVYSALAFDKDANCVTVREPLNLKANISTGGSRSRAIRTAMLTGTYAVVLGFGLMAFPIAIYGLLFDKLKVTHGLIRLGGSFLVVIGMQYLGTALGDRKLGTRSQGFYSSTVVSRLFLVVSVGFLVGVGFLEWTWLAFAGLNGAGAISMALAMQKDSVSRQQNRL